MCHCTPAPDTALAALVLVLNKLTHLEELVSAETDAVAALSAKVDDLIADVRAKLVEIAATVSPEGQAALDELNAKLDAFDAEVGDADGSDTPPVE